MPSESTHRFHDEVSTRQTDAEFAGSEVRILRGQALPYGATRTPHGLNFAVVSRHATDAWLVIASDDDAT